MNENLKNEILNDQNKEWFWSKMSKIESERKMTFFGDKIFWKIKIDPFDDEDMLWKWLMVGDCWQVDLST